MIDAVLTLTLHALSARGAGNIDVCRSTELQVTPCRCVCGDRAGLTPVISLAPERAKETRGMSMHAVSGLAVKSEPIPQSANIARLAVFQVAPGGGSFRNASSYLTMYCHRLLPRSSVTPRLCGRRVLRQR